MPWILSAYSPTISTINYRGMLQLTISAEYPRGGGIILPDVAKSTESRCR